MSHIGITKINFCCTPTYRDAAHTQWRPLKPLKSLNQSNRKRAVSSTWLNELQCTHFSAIHVIKSFLITDKAHKEIKATPMMLN